MCTRSALFKNGKNCETLCPECNVLTLGKRLASHEVDGVIGLSNHVLKAHIDGGYFKTSRPAVLPNFIPDAIMVPRAANFSPRTMHSPPVFGYMGTIAPLKGIDVLSKAYKNVYSKTPIKMILAGQGEHDYVDNLKKELSALNTEFPGWVDQNQVLPKVDFLIIPSLWHEPLGRVVLEAFSYGIPVIGSARGGIPDMIQHGYNGYLFDPDQPGSLEEAMIAAGNVGRDYAQLSENAFTSLKSFREPFMIKKYEDYFREIKAAHSS